MHEIDQDLINRGLMEIIDTPHNRQLVLAHPRQATIDSLSAHALVGKVDWYIAKQAVETEDWKLAEQLIAEAVGHDG